MSTPDHLWPTTLTWAEVDPSRHPFDAEVAPAEVRRLVGSRARRGEGDAWVVRTSTALVRHYGRWASGWCWGRGESFYDGGPVASWCCPADSPTTPHVVATALVEWRSWVEDLDARFRRLLPEGQARSPDAWERAVTHLVTAVAERTGAESGWYDHCRQVLRWSLAAAGVPEKEHRRLVAAATDGRFHSWVGPTDREVARVARDLTTGLDARG